MIKTNFLKIILLCAVVFAVSCSSDTEIVYGNWVESSTFDGNARGNSIAFVIGDKGYLVTGYDGDDYLSDTWEYNSTDDYWMKKADFPGTARSGAVGFELNGKGYIGTGYDGDDELQDFWQYDPVNDAWTQKADFAGTARYGAIGFSVAGNGYIGTGYDGSELKDFWKYDDVTDSWEQTVGFGGQKRKNASVFVIDDVAYIGAGIHNGGFENDFYAFNGMDGSWTRLKDLDDADEDYSILLESAVAFTLGGKGYFATGVTGGLSSLVWEYDVPTDTWIDRPDFEGTPRQDAVAFSFSNSAYVLMGRSGSYYFDDIWKFNSEEEENEDD